MPTPAPTDPLLLPAHQPRAMSAQARAAQEPVRWEKEILRSVTKAAARPYWRGYSAEAIWSVSERGEGQDRVCELSLFPKCSPQERQKSAAIMESHEASTVEWHLAFGRANVVEFGYAFTPELAKGLADLMRYQEPGFDAQGALAAAGFVEDPPSPYLWARRDPNDPTKQYTKKINGHSLRLEMGPYGCKLEFHRRQSHRHLNLYHITLVKAADNGKVYPMVWPEGVASPASVVLAGALLAAEAFEQEESARVNARKAKKAAKLLSMTEGL